MDGLGLSAPSRGRMNELPQPPSSAFAQAVHARVAGMPGFLLDHCTRSWQLAALALADRLADVDTEVLYAGAMLHDLGLWEQVADPDERFEAHGANTARDLAREHGLGESRANNLWDVVALHADALAAHKSPETAALSVGVRADVSGGGLDQLPPHLLDDVFATRGGFSPKFFDVLVAYSRNHPGGAAFTWLQPVVAPHLPEIRWPDLEARAGAHPYE